MKQYQPHNFTEQGDVNMYGQKPSFGQPSDGYGPNTGGSGGYGPNTGVSGGYGANTASYGQGSASYGQGANFNAGANKAPQGANTSSQSLQFQSSFNANSNRPPVVSQGGCCCNVM